MPVGGLREESGESGLAAWAETKDAVSGFKASLGKIVQTPTGKGQGPTKLVVIVDPQNRSAADSDDVVDRFVGAELGAVDDAARLLELGEHLRLELSPRHLPLRGIANRIDLLA